VLGVSHPIGEPLRVRPIDARHEWRRLGGLVGWRVRVACQRAQQYGAVLGLEAQRVVFSRLMRPPLP
jgi:hypothetical protein